MGQPTRIFDFIWTRLTSGPCMNGRRIGSCGPGCLFRLGPGSRADTSLTNSIQRRTGFRGGGSTRKYSVNNVTIPGPDLATANYLETLYTVKVH
jgi:hypothetical protein